MKIHSSIKAVQFIIGFSVTVEILPYIQLDEIILSIKTSMDVNGVALHLREN